MKSVKVVIGANLGDEGKGLITDFLVRQNEGQTVNIRYCGGAQAGHTVVEHGGRRHVFHHFGAGTFAGATTYLSRFFIVNPIVFNKEFLDLRDLGIRPKIIMDNDCFLTTPYDILINEIAEDARGSNRHGSCGCGINETVERCEHNEEFKLTVGDIVTEDFDKKLKRIRDCYVWERLDQLGISAVNIPLKYQEFLASSDIFTRYCNDASLLVNHGLNTHTVRLLLKNFDHAVFEGAQGLMLDEEYNFFPHVTRARTGISNVTRLLYELKMSVTIPEIVYVTRTYMTRHGNGPLPFETTEKPYSDIVDNTNLDNKFQGSLRFGLLDVSRLRDDIQSDLEEAPSANVVSIAMTCLDQCDTVRFILKNEELSMVKENFIEYLSDYLQLPVKYVSYGPTANAVKIQIDRRDYQGATHGLDPDTCKRLNDGQEIMSKIEEQQSYVS
jgi:adenylosuccinate synthase